MKWTCDTALVIADASSNVLTDHHKDQSWETSSTIKVPILLLTVHAMTSQGASLIDTLPRLPHHDSRGSGIINWTEWRDLSFRDLIFYMMVYSDCVAANILIDYIGGQAKINQWLEQQGFTTRLNMHYLYFSDQEDQVPSVGTTTASDMLKIYAMLDHEEISADHRRLINYAMSNPHQSWFLGSLGPQPIFSGWKHKTGSMIDCSPTGETIYNAVGSYLHDNKKYYFCLLSHGWLHDKSEVTPDQMKQFVIEKFTNQPHMIHS